MSALLALLVLGAAAWFLTNLAGRAGFGREPMESVAEFSRAMSALDPSAPPRRQS